MKQLILLVLLAGLSVPLSLGAQSSTPAADLAAANPVPVILVPGDAMRVVVWRNPELSGEFMIAADGTLRHPLLREVQVAGVPMEEVERRIRSYLQRLESNPHFVLEPLFRVTVSGEVRSPSIYSFPPEVTIAQAVVQAGGATELARINRVRLRRNGQEHVVDLTYPDLAQAQMPVRSGDQIIVPRRPHVWRDRILPVASVASSALSLIYMVYRVEGFVRR